MTINDLNGKAAATADILIVDDTMANLKLLTHVLSNAGYRTRPASSGELALRSARAKPPSLILLDVRMTGMDGFEVCRRLKDNALTRDVPIIFLTGLTETAEKSKAFELGAVDYITKPFHGEEVLARVRVHLALSTAQEQLASQVVHLRQANEQMAREIAENKAIQENLGAALSRLQALTAQVTKGFEEERHKLAYELHEQLGQEVASLKLYLEMLKTHGLANEAQTRLMEAQTIATTMLERIRSMSGYLHPHQLDTLGLYAALRGYCKQQAETAGWVLHLDIPERAQGVQSDVALACFRVVQGALANVAGHASATEVRLSLREDSNDLELRIIDNGVGFDANALRQQGASGNLGLTEMQERARQVGGRLEITSSHGSGTQIHAVFPRLVSAE